MIRKTETQSTQQPPIPSTNVEKTVTTGEGFSRSTSSQEITTSNTLIENRTLNEDNLAAIAPWKLPKETIQEILNAASNLPDSSSFPQERQTTVAGNNNTWRIVYDTYRKMFLLVLMLMKMEAFLQLQKAE